MKAYIRQSQVKASGLHASDKNMSTYFVNIV